MAKEEKEKESLIPEKPFCLRWLPDFRYRVVKMTKVELNVFNSINDSVTDKEAYRITLASLRGDLSASGIGNIDKSRYEISPGEDYNPEIDLSYFYRPDITIVEIDQACARLKSQLEKYDGELKTRIQKELAKAELKRTELIKSEKPNEKEGEAK